MYKESLNLYDIRPEAMTNYIRYNGRHFSKKLCNWAVSLIDKDYDFITKSQIDELLKSNNITLHNSQLYDYVYIANVCKAYYYGSSITNDNQLVLFIKDTLENAYDGQIFNRWYSDMCGKGIAINWEDLL